MDPLTILAGIPAIAPYVPWIIAAAAVAAMAMPPPAADATGWYPALYRLVNTLGANRGHAANATAPKP